MGERMQTYISTLDAVGDIALECGERDLEGSDGSTRPPPCVECGEAVFSAGIVVHLAETPV